MTGIRTILHPTDVSARSELAFRLAAALAHACGARLVILNVMLRSAAAAEEPRRQANGQQATTAEKLVRLLPPDPSTPVEHLLEEGDSAAEILHDARVTRADLVVMGTHGRTGLRRLLMGSVAEQVLRQAACPVVTVTTPSASPAPVECLAAPVAGEVRPATVS